MAAARKAREDVERWAGEALTLARGGRPKYEVATLVTRAKSRKDHALIEDALADLDRAVVIARSTGDPALLLRALIPRCEMEEDERLAREARELAKRIEAGCLGPD